MGPWISLSPTLEHTQDKHPTISSRSRLQTQTPSHINPLSCSPRANTLRKDTHTQIDIWPDSKMLLRIPTSTHIHIHTDSPRSTPSCTRTELLAMCLCQTQLSDPCTIERTHHFFPVLHKGWWGMGQKPVCGTEAPLARCGPLAALSASLLFPPTQQRFPGTKDRFSLHTSAFRGGECILKGLSWVSPCPSPKCVLWEGSM